jgi:hypothetical protein
MTEKDKIWIDTASYLDLFRRWRFAPAGDPILRGATGAYYAAVMAQRRKEVGDAEHTRISKLIGWEP